MWQRSATGARVGQTAVPRSAEQLPTPVAALQTGPEHAQITRTTEIENQLRQPPFVPFLLRMPNGKAIEVRHPETLLVPRTILGVATYKPNGRRLSKR